MAKPDKKSKGDLSSALTILREELRQDVHGITESIEQLKVADSSANDRAAMANSLQALRQELCQKVQSLSQQIEQAQLEQAQSMLVTPEADTTEFTSAVSGLREEVRQNVSGLAESIEQLKAIAASGDRQADTAALTQSIQALREELRDDAARLSQLIEQVQLEQSERAALVPAVDTSEFSNALEDLRGELKRDVQSLSQAIARNEPLPPKGSPVLTTVAILASLAAGAFGMSFYQRWTEDQSQPQRLAGLDAKLVALNSKMESLGQTDLAGILEEARSKEAARQQLAADQLNDTIVGLQNALNSQDERLTKGLADMQESLASELRKIAGQDVVTVAKPPLPDTAAGDAANNDAILDPAAKAIAEAQGQPDAEAQAEAATSDQPERDPAAVAEAEATKEDNVAQDPDSEQSLDKVQNIVRSPVRGKLIIDNPSRFDIELKINGEEVKIGARGVTTIPMTQGMVETAIGTYTQEWDDWKVVDGEPRLKITVESGADYYKLIEGSVAETSGR